MSDSTGWPIGPESGLDSFIIRTVRDVIKISVYKNREALPGSFVRASMHNSRRPNDVNLHAVVDHLMFPGQDGDSSPHRIAEEVNVALTYSVYLPRFPVREIGSLTKIKWPTPARNAMPAATSSADWKEAVA